MIARPLTTPAEYARSADIATVSFAGASSQADPGSFTPVSAEDARQYGVFDDDGVMMARCNIEYYRAYVGAAPVSFLAMGGIATLPEYRNRGCVRVLMSALTAHSYEQGYELAYLFPFSHSYYRKFQFENVGARTRVTIPMAQFAGRRFTGTVCHVQPDTPRGELIDLYRRWAARYTLAQERSDTQWEALFAGDLYRQRCYTYAMRLQGRTAGYLRFTAQDYPNTDMFTPRILSVQELVWDSSEALRQLLAFIATFGAKYKDVVWDVPPDVDVFTLFDEPFDIRVARIPYGMMRVIHAPGLLRRIAPCGAGRFTLRLHDPQLSANDGRFAIEYAHGTTQIEALPGGDTADVEMSIAALTQTALGYLDLHDALQCRQDVALHSAHAAAHTFFARRKVHLNMFF